MTYEELQIENDNLNIQELDLSGILDLKGLYIDGNIAIHKNLPEKDKACVLAEELGHYHTSSGNILDLRDVGNKKQERVARLWAYEKMITLEKIISAKKAGCCNRYEIADYLEVTEEFLQEAIVCYRSKYGLGMQKGEYIVFFEPFNVCKMTD